MRRLTAAVLATAAVGTTVVGIVSGAVDSAVRAEVAVSGKGHPFDVRRIRILDGLTPGESYRLPAFGVRNHRGLRTSYRLIVSAGAARAERLPPRRWLRFVPAAVVIDAGQSRAVAVRLQLPADAEPGVYGVVLGVRPGGPEGTRLTFRIEPAESTGAGHRRPPASSDPAHIPHGNSCRQPVRAGNARKVYGRPVRPAVARDVTTQRALQVVRRHRYLIRSGGQACGREGAGDDDGELARPRAPVRARRAPELTVPQAAGARAGRIRSPRLGEGCVRLGERVVVHGLTSHGALMQRP